MSRARTPVDIDGQVALVAGGAGGAGEAVARHFAGLGADVAILDVDGARAARVAAAIGGYSQQCDVADAEHVAIGVSSAMARFGQAPRIVVNCAALDLDARIVGPEGKVSIVLFRKALEVNLLGTYHVMSYAAQAMTDLPPLATGERGVIVNTAFAAREGARSGQAAPAASGGAIAALCAPATSEFSPLGIRVVAVDPGPPGSPVDAEPTGRHGAFARLVADVARDPGLDGTVIRLDGATRPPTG